MCVCVCVAACVNATAHKSHNDAFISSNIPYLGKESLTCTTTQESSLTMPPFTRKTPISPAKTHAMHGDIQSSPRSASRRSPRRQHSRRISSHGVHNDLILISPRAVESRLIGTGSSASDSDRSKLGKGAGSESGMASERTGAEAGETPNQEAVKKLVDEVSVCPCVQCAHTYLCLGKIR